MPHFKGNVAHATRLTNENTRAEGSGAKGGRYRLAGSRAASSQIPLGVYSWVSVDVEGGSEASFARQREPRSRPSLSSLDLGSPAKLGQIRVKFAHVREQIRMEIRRRRRPFEKDSALASG